MELIILIFHVLTALCMIVLILLQQGKGAGMGSGFGGGASALVASSELLKTGVDSSLFLII